MLRIAFGVVAAVIAWVILWFGGETILSAAWAEFGTHQAAFQAAIESGAPFTANSTILLVHIVLALVVSVIAGALAAMVAGENRRAPLILGILLFALGLLKAIMSWQLVPVWYHILFTAILPAMAVIGGRISRGTQ